MVGYLGVSVFGYLGVWVFGMLAKIDEPLGRTAPSTKHLNTRTPKYLLLSHPNHRREAACGPLPAVREEKVGTAARAQARGFNLTRRHAGAQQLMAQNRAVIARPDQRPHLPRLACPVLVMVGEADLLTPPERSQEIAALVPQAELVVVPRCGHMVTMERPEVVNAALVDWLSGTMSSRA